MNKGMTIIDINQAIQQISEGEIVILPFEDHFILCGLAKNKNTVKQLLDDQKKKENRPLSILFPSLKSIALHQIESPLVKIAAPVWPAPLSIIVPAFPGLPSNASGLTQMVSIQVPSHSLMAHLLNEIQEPLIYVTALDDQMQEIKSLDDCLSTHFKHVDSVVNGMLSEQGSTMISYQSGGYQILEVGQVTKAEIDHLQYDSLYVS
jgi:tRNA A37 threonylcarbamoyladenosine synthetase subunit TsaC/SUA5/YrdC